MDRGRILEQAVDEGPGVVALLHVGRELVRDQRSPLHPEGVERRAQTGAGPPHRPELPKPIVDPGKLSGPASVDRPLGCFERVLAGNQRCDRGIVGHVFGPEGELVPGLVGNEGGEFGRIQGAVYGDRLQHLVVGQEEPVLEAWPDRVLHHPLPKQGGEIAGVGILVGELAADVGHPPDPDQDPAGVFAEGNPLRIEEAERAVDLDLAEESVQHRALVEPVLDPLRIESHEPPRPHLEPVVEVDVVNLRKLQRFLSQHPPEGHAPGRIRRDPHRRDPQMFVGG